MMVDGEIEPVILVSIGYLNGYAYRDICVRDLVDGAESYLHFIIDNLVPYLSEIFPVDSENMTLTGHSMGGFWAIFAMFNNDTIGINTFKNFYIGSPYFPAETDGMNIEDIEKAYFERKKIWTITSISRLAGKRVKDTFLRSTNLSGSSKAEITKGS
jgi:hypothetical protein